MSDMHDPILHTAVLALERSVERWWTTQYKKKQQRRRRRRQQQPTAEDTNDDDDRVSLHHDAMRRAIRPLTKHARHVFGELRARLWTLQAGMECVERQIQEHTAKAPTHQRQQQRSSSSSSNSRRQTETTTGSLLLLPTLQHLFQFLLRLHDGYILCVSGECRHVGDAKRARRSQFPSHLTTTTTTTVSSKRRESRDDARHSTQLYASNHTYSGASWDEWNDATVGVRVRLMQALADQGLQQQQQQLSWDDLADAQELALAPWEALVTETEQIMSDVQSQFGTLKKKVVSACERLESTGPGSAAITARVHIKWEDKMEQLRYVSNHTETNGSQTGGGKKQHIQLARYASKFKVDPGQLVLPLEWTTVAAWQAHVPWPTLPNTKSIPKPMAKTSIVPTSGQPSRKRKVICDSSDEEPATVRPSTTTKRTAANTNSTTTTKDHPNPNHNSTGTATGLVVHVAVQSSQTAPPPQHQSSSATTESLSVSVRTIKEQHGVNVGAREVAMDEYTAEEAIATASAHAVDHPVEERYRRDSAVATVRRLERALASVVSLSSQGTSNDNSDDDDKTGSMENVWNAREHLREACMQAGDTLLWSSLDQRDDGAATRRLDQAHGYFGQAMKLVRAQETLCQTMHPSDGSSGNGTDAAGFYRRNLCLLRGQAQTNMGIASLERALVCGCDGEQQRDARRRTSSLDTALTELEDAVACAQKLQTLCVPNKEDDIRDEIATVPSMEQTLDLWRALALKSLALRWKGVVQWRLYQKDAAVLTFAEAAAVIELSVALPTEKEEGYVTAALECRAECYYAWTMMADLASQSLERCTTAIIHDNVSFCEKLLSHVTTALAKAAMASKYIRQMCTSNEQYQILCHDKDILMSNELDQSSKEITDWWDRRKTLAKQTILSNSAVANLPSRGDVTQYNAPETLPTQRFVATNHKRTRRSKYNLGGTGYSNVGRSLPESSTTATDGTASSLGPPPRKYRKWREEMEWDATTNAMVPKLSYPSLPPEMPPHIVAILAHRQACP